MCWRAFGLRPVTDRQRVAGIYRRPGKLFLEHVPRVFTALQQARDSVKAASNGFHGQLRIALI